MRRQSNINITEIYPSAQLSNYFDGSYHVEGCRFSFKELTDAVKYNKEHDNKRIFTYIVNSNTNLTQILVK